MPYLGTTSTKKEKRGWLLPLILLVVSVLLLTAWFIEGSSGILHGVRGAALNVSAACQSVGSVIGTPFRAIGNGFTNATASSEDLSTLQAQNDKLSAQVMQLEEYRQENERLNELLGLKDAYGISGQAARVTGRSTDAWNRVIIIDKGSSDGITPGLVVMDANGLVGTVEDVAVSSSTVRLISDQTSGVAALIQANRAEGIVSGSPEGLLYLNYIPVDTQVAEGDAILTSGSGGIYPKGIVIGEVLSVTHENGDLYHTIVVKPIANTDTYENVLVLTGGETEVAGAADAATADAAAATDGATTAEGGE